MDERKPAWLKVRRTAGSGFGPVASALRNGGLHTVCEEARCPNRADCWSRRTATFLLLGDSCTRGCAFCSVRRAPGSGTVDDSEPDRVARAAADIGLRYVVITSVARDDLPDGGASMFRRTIVAVRVAVPGARVEALVPDYRGEALAAVLSARPDVLAHNIEVVRRLTPALRHSRCGYDRSLATLAEAKRASPGVVTKSSLLLGFGESKDEVIAAMRDLRGAGVDALVLGQYLRPTPANVEVARYVDPGEFAAFRTEGEALGFSRVVAEPLARTSLHAEEVFGRSGVGGAIA